MEFPGGIGSEHLGWFGGGPHSHGLNPFDSGPNTSAPRFVLSHNQQDSPDMTGVGYNNSFIVKTVAQRMPMMAAGWGYDLMGRPTPNLHRNLQDLNTSQGGAGGINWYHEDSNWFDDNRVTTDGGDEQFKSSFPYGGDASPSRYVGGAVDLRYDPRHGLWRGNHFILAEILGHATRVGSSASSYYREYEWREVEIGYVYGNDPFRRSESPSCDSACEEDPLDYPARSFSTSDADQVYIYNAAVNVSEVGYDSNYGPRPLLGPAVPSGTIVQLRSVNSIYGSATSNAAAVFGPSFIFSHAIPHKIFVEITGNQALQLPLDAEPDDYYLEPGNEDIGLYDNPTTRWYYTGRPMKWSGWADIGADADGYENLERFCQFGTFVQDGNQPSQKVRLLNITEWNNPLARDGRGEYNHVVSPGVNMAKNDAVAYPSGFTIRPISNGTIVEAHYMPDQYVPDEMLFPDPGNNPRPLYYFSLANAHAGCCDAISDPEDAVDSIIKAGRCISTSEGISEGLAGRPAASSRKN